MSARCVPIPLALMALAACLTPAAAPSRAVQPEEQPAEQPAEERQTAENNAFEGEIIPQLNDSILRGLDWLATQQNDEGSFGGGRYGRNVAITALACLAFMGDGSLPGRGPYGHIVHRGLEHVLESSTESGLIASPGTSGPMYGHGFATLFLGEVYGMTAGGGDTVLSQRVHEALVKAVRLIERSQNADGGWRYNPVPFDADISVTICQVMALRSARNAGIEVSKETIDRAVEYVRLCQMPDGGFRYQLDAGTSAWPRSAAGVASLYYAGIYEDQAIERGLRYLFESAFPGLTPPARAHYYYGHYYASQAMYLAGGRWWKQWWPAIRDELIGTQQNDGSWEDRAFGSPYATAMSLIILQMPKRYLPIFQK